MSNVREMRKSIGREAAINLAESGWWKGRPAREVAEFQMFTNELCMDWSAFQAAMEETLGRPVFTHEFGLDWDGLARELLGEREAPSMSAILALIPGEKLIVVAAPSAPAPTLSREGKGE